MINYKVQQTKITLSQAKVQNKIFNFKQGKQKLYV